MLYPDLVKGVGFGSGGSRFSLLGLMVGVSGLGFWVEDHERVYVIGFEVQGLRWRV